MCCTYSKNLAFGVIEAKYEAITTQRQHHAPHSACWYIDVAIR
jgi:hypothetical protein